MALGEKLIEMHRLQKEWKAEQQTQHKELVNALTALELALTKSRTMGEEAAPVPTVRMYEGNPPATGAAGPPPAAPPSVGDPRIRAQNVGIPEPGFAAAPFTFGASAGEPAGREYYESPGQSVPAAFRVQGTQYGLAPGY